MTIDDYLQSIHLALIDSPVVDRYVVVRQRTTSQIATSGWMPLELVSGNAGTARHTTLTWMDFHITATTVATIIYSLVRHSAFVTC